MAHGTTFILFSLMRRPDAAAARCLAVDRRKNRCRQRGKVGYLRWNWRAGPVAAARESQGIRAMNGKELLRVSVLGSLAVLHHHMRMLLPPSKKTRALLAYLAVTACPHSRDRLCAMFWPVPDDPRAALR
jgi:hypothetical protein